MQIKRLRLIGFKSFVDPTELLIEPGLTGVVGPNGCGKSNLLEALRWVMGETSHKSMRAAAMDDVIFSGTQGRPARNSAEVMILLDNSDRTAPAELNGSDTIEVVRHIEREAGSIYRVNGRDVRARDVKLLFEDAATGARSPALVRQGQIGEIVNAKPEQRRRILEDAAGIAGLHSRRHEAELRLKAAEANLARLGDVLGQLNSQMTSLKRQARQAKRYKEISGEMRRAEAIVLHLSWLAAQAGVEAEEQALQQALQVLGLATEAEARCIRLEAEAAEAIQPLREAEAVKAAILQRVRHEAETLEQQEADARERHGELAQRIEQMRRDEERERGLASDAAAQLARLGEEKSRLETEPGASEATEIKARHELEQARLAQQEAEDALGLLTNRLAEERANRRRLEALIAEETSRSERAARQLGEIDRLLSALPDDGQAQKIATLVAEIAQLESANAALESGLVAAECRADETATALQAARTAVMAARLEAEKIATEAQTIRRLVAPAAGSRFSPLLDQLKVARGYETALGAALGDDLDAALSPEAPVHWLHVPAAEDDGALPAGVTPLSRHVKGPVEIERRLAQTGVIEPADGPALHRHLRPGQMLVSKQGHLWRWDGLVADAGAETPAAIRLAQRNRLEQLESEETEARSRLAACESVLAAATAAATAASDELIRLRSHMRETARRLSDTRDALQKAERRQSETAAKRAALAEGRKRQEESLAEHAAKRETLAAELAALADMAGIEGELEQARIRTERVRQTTAETQALVAGLERERRQRQQRLAAIADEMTRAHARAEAAETQLEGLLRRMAEATQRLAELAAIPEQIAVRRSRILEEVQKAESERARAADALAEAETRLRDASRLLREAQSELAGAREHRARVEVRLEGAREKRAAEARRIRETLDCDPDGCLTIAGLTATDLLPELAEVERRLMRLREDRERLGGVNLRAEEELEELTRQFEGMDKERADLEEAIARLRQAIGKLNREGRARLEKAFGEVNAHFQRLFTTLFNGGEARLELIEAEDPLEGGLEIIARPPGKKPATLSLLSGGEQSLTALSLIFAVFLTNPSPICVLDEVDAPLDDSNVDRFCTLMEEMARTTDTRFLVITHHPMTMSRMHRLYGVTMVERGVSQLVSVDLTTAARFREAG